MSGIFYWEMLGLTLSLAVFLLSAGVNIFLLFGKWSGGYTPALSKQDQGRLVSEAKKTTDRKNSFFARCAEILKNYRWEFFLGGVFLFLFLFAWFYAPPRLNGGFAHSPGESGRPFYNLRWGRKFLQLKSDLLWSYGSSLIGVFSLFLLARSIQKKSRSLAEFLLLLASANLAVLGQWLISQPLGWVYYGIASSGFALWTWQKRDALRKYWKPKPINKSAEIAFVLFLALIASFARLYALQNIPYGIEGDEAKWTAEAINLVLRGVPDGSGEYHRDALPVSYYLQTPLQRLLGPGIYAARLTVALLSVLGSVLFYLYLRRTVSFPVAALSAFLLSVSIFDISASRLANVESFVKIFPILTLLLLNRAIASRRWAAYAVAGVALALGMLTYDTLWLLLLAAIALAWIEMTRQKENRTQKAKNLSALLAPTVLTLPLLVPYLSSRLDYYAIGEKWQKTDWQMLFSSLANTWFYRLRPDFLYNREGSLLNAVLLPFLVFGLTVSFLYIKERASYWHLLWGGIFIIPVPILTHSFLGRVYYPALPALYFFIGLGIVIFAAEVNGFFPKHLRPFLTLVALLFFTWLPFSNFFIYFNEVFDPKDRQVRREIGEFAAQAAGEDALILLPAVPNANTPLNNEYQTLETYLLQEIPSGKLENAYRYVAPEKLLQEIKTQKENRSRLEIFIDEKETPKILEALQRCYPQGKLYEGEFLTRVSLSGDALQKGECTSLQLSLTSYGENQLYWSLDGGETKEVSLYCLNYPMNTVWLEAENLPLSSGWQVETRFASGWSGTGFVLDDFVDEPFFISVEEDFPSPAYIWLRYYKRKTEKAKTYLRVDGVKYFFANPPEGELNRWLWERVGPLPLGGDSQLAVVHPEGDEPFMALFLDALIITDDAAFFPKKSLTDAVNPLRFSFERMRSEGFLFPALPSGNYRCQARVDTERPSMMSGEKFLLSEVVELKVDKK